MTSDGLLHSLVYREYRGRGWEHSPVGDDCWWCC